MVRPGTLAEVARTSKSLKEFGLNLRDWQHEVRDKWRGRRDFSRKIAVEPQLLCLRFPEGAVADAYLAAYALWLADKVGVPRVRWASAPGRILTEPWFSGPKRASLLRDAPAHFIERNLFTIPDDSFLERKLSRVQGMERKNTARRVRAKTRLTQEQFARTIGVKPATLRNWEQGRLEPKGTAKTLLNLLDKRPSLAAELSVMGSSPDSALTRVKGLGGKRANY